VGNLRAPRTCRRGGVLGTDTCGHRRSPAAIRRRTGEGQSREAVGEAVVACNARQFVRSRRIGIVRPRLTSRMDSDIGCTKTGAVHEKAAPRDCGRGGPHRSSVRQLHKPTASSEAITTPPKASTSAAATTSSAPTTTAAASSACTELKGTVGDANLCTVHTETPNYTIDMSFPADYPDQRAVVDVLTNQRHWRHFASRRVLMRITARPHRRGPSPWPASELRACSSTSARRP
jgi:hypothetical protein